MYLHLVEKDFVFSLQMKHMIGEIKRSAAKSRYFFYSFLITNTSLLIE